MSELTARPPKSSQAAYEPWNQYAQVPFIDIPALQWHLLAVRSPAFTESGLVLDARLAESVYADEFQAVGRLIETQAAESATSSHTNAEERRRVDKVISLLDEWMSDESGYDEEAWPELKASLERNRLSSRKLFDD